MKLSRADAGSDPSGAEEAPADPSASAAADAVYAFDAQRGDSKALTLLVERHHAAVSRLLWRFVRTKSDLDDLVQETFLRMVKGLPQWRAQQPFGHWLLRIATNTGRDYFRRQSVRRRWLAEPTELEPNTSMPDAVDQAPDPAARAAANEVKTILAHLPADERTLLTLHHLEGWSMAQVAEHLDWTVTATKLRAWRARRRLRAFFQLNEST